LAIRQIDRMAATLAWAIVSLLVVVHTDGNHRGAEEGGLLVWLGLALRDRGSPRDGPEIEVRGQADPATVPFEQARADLGALVVVEIKVAAAPDHPAQVAPDGRMQTVGTEALLVRGQGHVVLRSGVG